MIDTSKSTFVLCMGAPKSGTTWLYRFFDNPPVSSCGERNEYRVWDALYHPEHEEYRVAPEHYHWIKRLAHDLHLRRQQEILSAKMIHNTEYYFDYFCKLLRRKKSRIVADTTPSYIGLPVKALSRIKNGFDERGIQTVPIMSLRDPVARCWSHMKMWRKLENNVEGIDFKAPLAPQFSRFIQTPIARLHTAYSQTIENIRRVYPQDSVVFTLFETLFTRREMDRLGCFFDMTPKYHLLDSRVNEGDGEKLPDEEKAEARRILSPVYDYCYEQFPETRELWTPPLS